MKTKVVFLLAAVAMSLLFIGNIQAQTFYTDRGTFQADNPGLALDDFNTLASPGTVCSGLGPWSSAGGAPCFGAGEMLPGASYDAFGVNSQQMVVLGDGFFGAPTAIVGPNSFADDLRLDFSDPGNTAVGLDFICLNGASTASFNIYGAGGLIGTSAPATCPSASTNFFGVAAGEAIVRIEMVGANSGLIDNLEFGMGDAGDPPPARATFAVWKDFDDDNPAEVLVTLSCNTGLPLQQTKRISDNDSLPESEAPVGVYVGDPPVNFVVVDFADGELDCAVTEEEVDGYEASYFNDTVNSDTSCGYEDVGHGAAELCQITNSLQTVDIDVTKEWIDENPAFNASNFAEAIISCSNVAFCELGTEGGCDFEDGLSFYGNPDTDGVSVFPHWNGTTSCSVTEIDVFDGGVEINDSDCQSLSVTPGQGNSCTITNTRLYEGIPTLSQYGLTIMILVMLGIGMIGFRRFV